MSNTNDHVEKPPIGLIPRWLWLERRREEVIAAILRYAKVQKPIPEEWAVELAFLNDELTKLTHLKEPPMTVDEMTRWRNGE